MSTPRASTVRPLTIFDAMTLVAAVAVGIAVSRGVDADQVVYLNRGQPALMPLATLTMLLIEWLPLPAALSLAVLGLNCKAPRPPARRLARRPGFAACLAVLVAMVGSLTFLTPLTWTIGLIKTTHHVGEVLLELLASQIGVGVATAWLLMALKGAWTIGPSWLERLGVALGAFWVFLTLAFGFVVVMDML